MVDKSFSALPRFISEGIFGNLVSSHSSNKSVGRDGISRGFDLFVQSVGKAKNKYEEEQIINRELQTLKTAFSESDISKLLMRDYLCRLIYARMLGYDVSFGFVPAVKQICLGSLSDRKVGYFACCQLLQRDDEITLLLICSFQKDITSHNLLENLSALSACSQLLSVSAIPHIFPAVLDSLTHSRELVRQKALLCLYQFQLLVPDLLEPYQSDLEKMLYDKDPGVMAAAVYIVHNSIERDPSSCKRFGESLVSILKQISSHKMATMFEFQTIPFPWLQIQILKCLTKLSAVDESLASNLVPLMKEILQKTSIKESIAISILYECIQCILCINPPKHLLDEAAVHIGRFLKSRNPNLKFIGVKLLVSLVRVNRDYSTNYQKLIVQSLENPEINVQRKMYKLLFEITSKANVQVVCAKFLAQLQSSSDKFWRSEVITMVINIIDRFDEDRQWLIETLFSCLQLGNDVIRDNTLSAVMNMVEKKFLIDGSDQRCQKLLVQKCVGILVNNSFLGTSLQLSTWVLGELCPLLKNMPDDKVISLLTRHLTNDKLAYSVRSSIVTALQSLVMKGVVDCVTMATKIEECLNRELPTVIKQRLSVILGVCRHNMTVSCHDNIDTTLTFLDDFVTDDLEQGGTPYIPPHLRGVSSESEAIPSIFSESAREEESLSDGQPRAESTSSSIQTAEERTESGLKLSNVKRVWGKQGRLVPPDTQSIVDSDKTNLTDETEVTRQKELASALFGGFQDDEKDGFLPNSSDKAGWRNLHSSIRAETSQQSTGLQDIGSRGNLQEASEMAKYSSGTETLINFDNLASSQVDVIGTKERSSLYDEQGDLKADENFLETADDNKLEEYKDEDVDQAISALLDNLNIESEHVKADSAESSLEQLDSSAFSEKFTNKNKEMFHQEQVLETNSSSAADGSGSLESIKVISIYKDDTTEQNDQFLSDGTTNDSIYSSDT